MFWKRLSSALCAVVGSSLLTVSASSSNAAVILEKLVADGDVDPVTGLTYTIASSGNSGYAGKLWLNVTLSGPGVTDANDQAWLYGDAASPRQVLREGDTLPGHTAADKVSSATGSVGPSGWYGATVTPDGGGKFATVIGNGATAAVIAKTGDVSADTGGRTMVSATVDDVVSETRYSLMTYLPKIGSFQPLAYYRTRSDGSRQLLTTTDSRMPQLAPENQSMQVRPAIHNASHSMWTLTYATPGYPYASGRKGLFMSRDDGHALVLNDGAPQPTNPATGAANARGLWLSESGQFVLASGFLTSTNGSYGTGIYSGDENSLVMRRLPTQVFVDQPGRMLGGVTWFDSNRAGRIVFSGSVATTGFAQVFPVVGYGNADEGFRTAAIAGTAAPGLSGITFSSFDGPGATGNSIIDPDWINDEGDFVFRANLAGTGVDASNDVSLWSFDRAGVLAMIAREGDVITVDGLPKTIATLGAGPAFFDEPSNRYVFQIQFTDNSRGFFSTAAIPEPSGLAVTGVVAGSLAGLRRRRTHF